MDIIWKQKRISDDATQQLLVDTYNLKTLLLQLPLLGPAGDSAPTASASSKGGAGKPPAVSPLYAKLVNMKVAHIEMVLKLISTPEEMLLVSRIARSYSSIIALGRDQERFRIMWPDGQPSDLQQIMSLKGTKRNDQQAILEMLGLSAASKLLNKTATTIFTGSGIGSSAPSGGAGGGVGGGGGGGGAIGAATSSGGSVAGNANSNLGMGMGIGIGHAAGLGASAAAHMKILTQDISSTARNIGNLKWTTTKN